MNSIDEWEQKMIFKWSKKYNKHLQHIIKIVRNEHFVTSEFEIYYTSNHNHEMNYISDLISFKNYL
jgi:hypothetical protein